MAHVPLPPITPRTGLWGLGFRMETISTRFYRLYQDIANVWMFGKWLSWPFYLLSVYFNSARDKCWESDQDLVYAITWVKGLVEGSIIADILERIWYEFTFLRNDPIGWVRLKIDQVSGELQFLRIDPYGWMRSRLYAAFPVFYNLLGNSGWWVYNELSNRYPEFSTFINNPWSYIKNKVLSQFWWARALDSNPVQLVINWINAQTGWFWDFIHNPSYFIYQRVRAYNWDLNILLTDPLRWFKEKLASALGMYPYEMDNFITSLIKRAFSAVLSNQGGLLDYVKEAMVNLILRFI